MHHTGTRYRTVYWYSFCIQHTNIHSVHNAAPRLSDLTHSVECADLLGIVILVQQLAKHSGIVVTLLLGILRTRVHIETTTYLEV